MVTVVQRPQGLKLIDEALTAVISGSGAGSDAVVTRASHGLATGSYVYIQSDIDEYNGMWYVTSTGTNTFKISTYAGADFVEWYQNATIEYAETATHEWSSAYLPIVYKATNDRWPENTVDTIRTVSSQADDNGYTQLTLSGSAGVDPLEYVKLIGGSAAGVWQVVEVSGSIITITLPYDAGNTFSQAQKYYNTYQVLVNIYAGLPGDHPWNYKKPVELVAQLSFTPDNDNTVMFSVADYIRKHLTIRNNPLLYSQPLNLDFFTGFYISTAERYDGSDGYTITTEESEFEVDDFQGYAVAGKLAFKNLYSGFYSHYIYATGSPAKWLNNLTRVIAISGKYFDASFIKNHIGEFELTVKKYANDYLYETELIPYDDQGVGVYRIPVEFNPIYDEYCIHIARPAVPATPGSSILLITMDNCDGGTWTPGSSPQVTLTPLDNSGYLYVSFNTVADVEYSFSYQITLNVSPGTPATTVRIAILDDDCNVLDFASSAPQGGTSVTGTLTVSAPVNGTRIGIRITNSTLSNSKTYVLDDLDFDGNPATPAVPLTEDLCIEIIGRCVQDDGGDVVELSRRMLEDGGFRLLEDGGFRLLES